MKKTTFICIILAGMLTVTCSSQTLYKSYYDYQKTHVKEEYYANSYGVKNGAYTLYSEYGGILKQGTYKNDQADGKWIIKDEKGHTISDETWKDGVLNGPATYHDFFGTNNEFETTQSGNFKDGKQDGIWNMICYLQQIDGNNGSSPYFFYDKDEVPDAALKGCERIKFSMGFQNGKAVPINGKLIMTFYPSGKRYAENTLAGGFEGHKIKSIVFFPNGKLKFIGILDSTVIEPNGAWKVVINRSWKYPNGGSEDSIPNYIAQENLKKEILDIEIVGEKYASQNKYADAENSFLKVLALDSTYYNACYNIACLYSLQNINDKACMYLDKSIRYGFKDYKHIMQDTDLTNIRKLDRYKEIMDHYFPGWDK